MPCENITPLLEKALEARNMLFDERHLAAFRLFNGFLEGCSDLAVDLYAATLLVHNYAEPAGAGVELVRETQAFYMAKLPWLKAVLVKTRSGDPEQKRGTLTFGSAPDRKIKENGVWYAIDLVMNRDASLYLDTRNLRAWALENLRGKNVLNTFAYTGSLGVAAMAGGAARVVHLDLNRNFLNLAKTSYTLNGFPIHKPDFVSGDFFTQVSHFKRAGDTFDCVFLDAPFFSATSKGRVDLQNNMSQLINKVRPLIRDGGTLAAINNALFLSGRDYYAELESLCADGYLRIRELIPVPPDFSGYPETCSGIPISDPTPFNHTTKIAILEVRRKQASQE